MSFEKCRRVSKCAFLIALLLPLHVPPPAAAECDEGCGGLGLDADALAYFQFLCRDVYEPAFSSPFLGCDERPLLLDGMPNGEYREVIDGVRLLSTGNEGFVLSVLDYSPGIWDHVEDVVASGYLQAWLTGPAGSVPVNGVVFQGLSDEHELVTVFLPLGLMSQTELVVIATLHGEAMAERASGESDIAPVCREDCLRMAANRLHRAANSARIARSACLLGAVGGCGGTAIGCLWKWGWSWWGRLGCVAFFAGCYYIGHQVCSNNFNYDLQNAYLDYENAVIGCNTLPPCPA